MADHKAGVIRMEAIMVDGSQRVPKGYEGYTPELRAITELQCYHVGGETT